MDEQTFFLCFEGSGVRVTAEARPKPGSRVGLSGDAEGAEGQTVQLPDSPVELGAIRPYASVYAEYEASARQSLARRPLPPALEAAVQRYFSSIAPSEGSAP